MYTVCRHDEHYTYLRSISLPFLLMSISSVSASFFFSQPLVKAFFSQCLYSKYNAYHEK